MGFIDGRLQAADLIDDGWWDAVSGWCDGWSGLSLIRMHGVGVPAAGVGVPTASVDSGDNGWHRWGLGRLGTDVLVTMAEGWCRPWT